MTIENLAPLCQPAEFGRCIAPFGIDVNGVPWECATNGHLLFAQPGSRFEVSAEYSTLAATYLDGRGGVVVDLASLRSWAGDDTFSVEIDAKPCKGCKGKGDTVCAECDGSGECECRCRSLHDCGACDGEGYIECRECSRASAEQESWVTRYARFCGVVINQPLLARLLKYASGDTVRVLAGGALDPIRFFGDGWRGAIMPCRPEAADAGVPEFTVAA